MLELRSDLGGGKTTFVRGLTRGMGSTDHVSSPTFKISNVYTSSNLELHHFDFYRLQEAGIIKQELIEVMGQPDTVVVIEWPKLIQEVLPKSVVQVLLQPTGEVSREITFHYPMTMAYLFNNQ